MRNLTIRREKRFVGCLVSLKVYMEDPEQGDLNINGVLCRKLGELKNGEEKTFQIGEDSRKVYVIADKLSKSYCSEYYQLPQGQEDIALTGRNKFTPAAGNAFQFDNNDCPEVLAYRQRNKKKGLVVSLISVAVSLAIGWVIGNGLFVGEKLIPKEFSADGMTITLNEAFRETEYEGYTAVYDSAIAAVYVLKEPFSVIDGFEEYTLEQYADMVIAANGASDAQRKKSDGLLCFEYTRTNSENGKTYRYYAYIYKADDAFWVITVATEDAKGESPEQIKEWAKSVTFS